MTDQRVVLDWRPFASLVEGLRQSSEPKLLLERLLVGLVGLLGVERGFVLLRQGFEGPLVPVAAHGLEDPEQFVSFSESVCARALASGDVVVIQDTHCDPWYVQSSLRAVRLAARSIVCGPLKGPDALFGVIYLEGAPGMAHEQVPVFECMTGLAAELLSAARTRTSLLAAHGRSAALNTLAWEHERLVLGEGEAARGVKEHIQTAAPQDVAVLVTGETGTGKEMVARAIHRMSPRRDEPFVPVNCAALGRDVIEAELFGSERGAFTGATERRTGRFELASRGTLFLDEVGDLPLDVQVRLLRVLQDKTVTRVGGTRPLVLDFRLVCATNRDLEAAVRDGRFRPDLYYRVNVFRIHLAPLRERPEDLMALARHFLALFARRFGKDVRGFDAEAEALLARHPWPGNIRELKNAIERAVLMETTGSLRRVSLPVAPASAASSGVGSDEAVEVLRRTLPDDYEAARDAVDRVFFLRSLERHGGNLSAVAREAGLTRKTIYARLEKLGLSASTRE